MASVSVVWKGNCRHPEARYRLLGYLHRLALVSDGYLKSRRPERPRIVDAMTAERAGGPRRLRNIETVDKSIAGRVLISSRVSADPDALLASARREGVQILDDPEGESPPFLVIEGARLRGLDFKLFDPRELYPGADRMSFVFLECPDHPFLDGRIVEVTTAEDCEASGEPILRGASVYLTGPSIHLRYYLEDWTDCLFSWIRFFFIGDLWWQRWEELQGYSDYRGVFEELQADRGALAAEEATFEAMLATFRQYAEHWIGEVEGLAEESHG
jgi:hypothetical protein